jgi:hypothetical protein
VTYLFPCVIFLFLYGIMQNPIIVLVFYPHSLNNNGISNIYCITGQLDLFSQNDSYSKGDERGSSGPLFIDVLSSVLCYKFTQHFVNSLCYAFQISDTTNRRPNVTHVPRE